MQVGDKVVCVNPNGDLVRGGIYTITGIRYPERLGNTLYDIAGISWGRCSWRFKNLEEMQNTNFIRLVR
jgi:hypothetical protein